jgi:hypothetical protein
VTGFLHYQTGSYGGEGARIPAPPVARRGSKQRGGVQVAVAYPGSECPKYIAVALRITEEGSPPFS